METLYVGKEYTQAFLGFFCKEKTVRRGSCRRVCTHMSTHKQTRAYTRLSTCVRPVGGHGWDDAQNASCAACSSCRAWLPCEMDGENAGQGEHHADPPRSLPRKASNHITLSSPRRSQFLFAFLILRGPLANQKSPVPSGNALYCRRP